MVIRYSRYILKNGVEEIFNNETCNGIPNSMEIGQNMEGGF